MEIYDVSKVYQEFNYPKEFLKIVELNLVDFDFWYLMSKEQVEKRIKGLEKSIILSGNGLRKQYRK